MSKKKIERPYFPMEFPSREQKIDHGAIVDVVVNEVDPQKGEQTIPGQEMWEDKQH